MCVNAAMHNTGALHTGPPICILWREVSAAKERLQVWGQEDAHWPATTARCCLGSPIIHELAPLLHALIC